MHVENERHGVLLVDDDQQVARAMKWLLHGQGYDLEITHSAEEALHVLHRTEFDVVVTDVVMPGISGLDLLDRVRAKWPESEVVVVSAYDRTSDALRATRRGAFDYLSKPWDPKNFLDTVKRAAEVARRRRDLLGWVGLESPILESRSPAMRAAMRRLSRVATLDYDVLVTGPTGVGKSAFARVLHNRSDRRDGPFVTVDCGAFASQLVDSELFGHVRGAFTGAHEDRVGLIESASGGTLFLDEIGNMPLELQGRLLRVLQERVVRPVGGRKERPVDIRVISATCVDLDTAIDDGRFREDLFHRLCEFPIELPTLAERRQDIPRIAHAFLARHAEKARSEVARIAPDAMASLERYAWPGNLRELSHVIREAVALEAGEQLSLESLRATVRTGGDAETGGGGSLHALIDPDLPFKEAIDPVNRAARTTYLTRVLGRFDGNITAAARHAGLDRSNFRRLLRKYGVALG